VGFWAFINASAKLTLLSESPRASEFVSPASIKPLWFVSSTQ